MTRLLSLLVLLALPALAQQQENTARRNASCKTYDLGAGKHRQACASAPIHYRDDHGQWQEIELSFANGAPGELVSDRAPYVVRVAPMFVEVGPRDSNARVRWMLTATASVGGKQVNAAFGSIAGTWTLTARGLKWQSQPVTTPQGVRTERVSVVLVGGMPDFESDGAGGLVNALWRISAPIAIGADGNTYPIGEFIPEPGPRVSLALDDSSLPPSAYPYMIDPSQGPLTADSCTTNERGTECGSAGGDTVWTNPTNAQSDDTSCATGLYLSGARSECLECVDYDFSVTSGATIDGIEVTIRRGESASFPNCVDGNVRVIKGGTISGTDRASGSGWTTATCTTSDPTGTYLCSGACNGDSTDLWGETWSDTDINATTFGAGISALASGGTCGPLVNVITITVHYTEAGGTNTPTQTPTSTPTPSPTTGPRRRAPRFAD